MHAKPLTVLLIEDNLGDTRLIREILNEAAPNRIVLEHAALLSTGLELLDKREIDLVLLDLSLPDSQGIDTFHQLRSQAESIPIIVLTTLDEEKVEEEILRSGGQDYMVKTFLNYAILYRAIRHAIDRKRSAVS